MINFSKKLFLFLISIFFMNSASAESNRIHLLLDKGLVVIETYPDKAPKTVKRINELVNEGFYDGLTFHIVISGFMAQGCDPNGNGTGGSGVNIPAEFKLQFLFYRLKIKPFYLVIFHFIIRIFILLLPINILEKFYQEILRQKINV